MTAPAADTWERRLAREGLAPLDNDLGLGGAPHTATCACGKCARGLLGRPGEQQAAAGAWLAWARDVMDTHEFGGTRQRSVWRLYSEGATLTEIQRKLRVSRRAITRAIERVERTAPPAPCENPWRKSGRTEPKQRMDDSQVIALLRSLVARQLEGNDMAGITNKPNVVHYSRILLLPGRTVDARLARIGARDRVAFTDIDGRPHAGGIDVELETQDPAADNAKTITRVTLPWSMIRQAEQTRPDMADETAASGGKRAARASSAE